MLRAVIQGALFFLAPFAAYIVYLLLRQRYPFRMEMWTRATVTALSIVGLTMVAASIFGLALMTERHTGPYVPAHTENGQVVPGRFQ